jgi:hypothetical protein
MNKPLSPAAQAVLTAQAKQRCLFEWSNVNDPPCHPSDPDWNGCVQCIDRLGVAATLRAAADQVDTVNVPFEIHWDAYWPYRNGRAAAASHLLAIAAELEGAITTTKTP